MGASAAGRLPATKLVCTLGPATDGRVMHLVTAGVSVVRLNLAHGTPEEHEKRVRAVRAAGVETGRDVAILADLPGPKVRLGSLEDGGVDLEAGTRFTLRAGEAGEGRPGDGTGAATTHPALGDDLRPGDHVHLSDGVVELVVEAIAGGDVLTVVERGGRIRSGAGVNVPAARLSLPAVTDRDRVLAVLALALGVDLVGQSFVRTPADVETLRSLLGRDGPAIIAKIETRPAVDGFEQIARASDGVMIARGDLGLDLAFEDVPLVQKRLVARAVAMGKPVIVATQMLESMVTAARPTRAEASDVANAVLDGADAVMLSGETAIGAYPLLAAEAAIRICLAAEGGMTRPTLGGPAATAEDDSVATAAVALAQSGPEVGALVVASTSRGVVMHVAAHRPAVPVIAVVPDARLARRLRVVRGVLPVVPASERLAAAVADADAPTLLADPAVAVLLPDARRVVVLTAGDDAARGDRIELVTRAGRRAPVDAS